MRKTALLLCVLLLAGLLGSTARGQTPCVSQTDAGACFEAYDAATRQRIATLLCVGRPVRLRDCSGKGLKPGEIYYRQGSTTLCTGFTDTTTTFTPTVAGALVITQNTQGSGSGSQGIIFSKTYEVVAAPAPTFTVAVCSPGLVQVTITDINTSYNQYFVQIGNGPLVPAARNTPVSYPVAAPNTVTVTGRNSQALLCDGVATKPFTPLPAPRAPVLRSLTTPGDGTASFTFDALQPEYRYQLQVTDAAAPGGYRDVAAVPAGTTTLTLPAAPLPGCFRLLLQDQCEPPVFTQGSAAVCSVRLTGTALNGRNQLNWISAGTGTYSLTRTDATTTIPLPLPAGATEYADAAVTCGTVYRYRLTLTSGPAVSVANEVSLTAQSSTPPVAPRLAASFNLRNQVVLTTNATGTGGQLTYQRNGTLLANTTARTLTDSLAGRPTRPRRAAIP